MEKGKYTKPSLRAGILSRLKAKAEGKHSARLMQQVASAYKKAGGGYIGEASKAQKSIKKWTAKAGKQFVANTSAVKAAGRKARAN